MPAPRFVTVSIDRKHRFAHVRYLASELRDAADVSVWEGEIRQQLGHVDGKIDFVVDLGELAVKPGAVGAYDEARQRLFADFARRAYRYGGVRMVRTKILTSSTVRQQTANVFDTYDEALSALLADRE